VPVITTNEWNAAVKTLKEEREALSEHLQPAAAKESELKANDENAKLRQRLIELLTRLKAQKEQPKPTPPPEPVRPPIEPPKPPEPPKPTPKTETAKTDALPLDATVRPIDPLVLGHALFKAKNYEASLRAYRLIELQGMKSEERAPIQYLMAACLKKLGKTEEAAGIFREVANSKGDEYLALCAQWQLSTIRWQRETIEALKDVRRRTKALETPP
jgi:tetratricopeptide (TPR) repeat protein